jgi:hypothetical protein
VVTKDRAQAGSLRSEPAVRSSDARRSEASQADLILDNRLNLEAWFAQFIETVDVPHVVVSDRCRGHRDHRNTYVGKPNPHAWTSPIHAQIYVDNMVDAVGSWSSLRAHCSFSFACSAPGTGCWPGCYERDDELRWARHTD